MPDQAAALLARLREHVRCCARCDPAIGRYCATALPEVETFWDIRRDEIEAEHSRYSATRLALAAGGRG